MNVVIIVVFTYQNCVNNCNKREYLYLAGPEDDKSLPSSRPDVKEEGMKGRVAPR